MGLGVGAIQQTNSPEPPTVGILPSEGEADYLLQGTKNVSADAQVPEHQYFSLSFEKRIP